MCSFPCLMLLSGGWNKHLPTPLSPYSWRNVGAYIGLLSTTWLIGRVMGHWCSKAKDMGYVWEFIFFDGTADIVPVSPLFL